MLLLGYEIWHNDAFNPPKPTHDQNFDFLKIQDVYMYVCTVRIYVCTECKFQSLFENPNIFIEMTSEMYLLHITTMITITNQHN